MRRRNRHRLGDYLMTDDYTGNTIYASEAKRDHWGNYGKKVLERNPQEDVRSLGDPHPVPVVRKQDIPTETCGTLKLFIGQTNIRTPITSPGAVNAVKSLGEMEIGCTFIVY